MSETIEGKYRVELVTRNGGGDCSREVLYRHDNLALSCTIGAGCWHAVTARA
jgi:hypothetical protein